MSDRVYSYKILQDIDLSGNEIKKVSKIDTTELDVIASVGLDINSPRVGVDSTNIGIKSSSISIDNAEEILTKANSYVNTSTNVKSVNDSITVDARSVTVNSKDYTVDANGIHIESGNATESVVRSGIVEFNTLKTFNGDSNLKIEFDKDTNSLIFSIE